jgi:hypothetical protein
LALTYCTSCQVDHAPGEHQQSLHTKASSRGGRHLAPKSKRQPQRPALPKRKPRGGHRLPKDPVSADVPKAAFPTAEEMGSTTAAVLRGVRTKTGQGISTVVSALRQWGSEAATGLREAIDVGGFSTDDSKARPKRLSTPDAQSERIQRAGAVGVLERGDPGIELSMLESLGFYTDDSALVVTVAEPVAPGIAPTLGVPDSRSQVPDLDIGGWRPHVIARSKLGGGRLSSTAIIGLSVTLIVLMAMIASLLRAPAQTAARQDNQLAGAATELVASLSRLDAVMATPTGEVAESTSLLLDVDRSARDLFDLAASLPEDNASRQAAIGAAQSALAMETALGDALSYRVILQPLWNSPALSGVTDSTEAASMLASWQVELASMAESFPNSPPLDNHITQVSNFIAGFDEWRVRYLDAVTAGDSAKAGAAEADLEGQLALLAQAGEETLGAVFTAADAERARLLRALDSLRA